jgi:hypothetical protein
MVARRMIDESYEASLKAVEKMKSMESEPEFNILGALDDFAKSALINEKHWETELNKLNENDLH